MTDAFTERALERIENGGKNVFFTKSTIQAVIRIKQAALSRAAGVPAAAGRSSRRRQQGAGGDEQQDSAAAQHLSKRVLKKFHVAVEKGGATILLRYVKRNKKWRWCKVVALEDLPQILKEHHHHALGFSGINKLYPHLAYNVPTELEPLADGTPLASIYGLEGFDRDTVTLFLQACAVKADQQDSKEAEQPAPQAIAAEHPFFHIQADQLDIGDGRDELFRYILVIIDLFTRHVWLRPVPTKEAIHVARELYFFFQEYQPPRILHTDNGKEFTAGRIQELCKAYGIELRHGAPGNPQCQGAVERHNRLVKDKISGHLMISPTIGWPFQLMRVQRQINDEPAEALGGTMTRSQAMFGQPNQHPLQPPAEVVSELLQMTSYRPANPWQQAAAPSAAAIAAGPGTAQASHRRGKRSAAVAELDEEAELLAEEELAAAAAAAEPGTAPAAARRPRRQAAANFLARLGVEASEGEEEAEPLVEEELAAGPAVAAATAAEPGTSAAAGRGPMRQAAADFLATLGVQASEGEEEAEAMNGPAVQPPQRRVTRSAAAAQHGLLLMATAAEAEQLAATVPAVEGAALIAVAAVAEQQAAEMPGMEGATGSSEAGPAVVQAEEQQEAEAAEEQAAGSDEAGNREPGGSRGAPLPAHLKSVRAAVAAAQEKNRKRIMSARRAKGTPKNFLAGDAVLLRPPKRGKIGRPVGPKRIVCRVIKVTFPFGGNFKKFQLRSRAGVLESTYPGAWLEAAPAASAAKLGFDGTATEGVPVVSLNAAMAAEVGGGTIVSCGCRGKCGSSCKCKKAGVLCGRACRCITGKGGSCENHNH